VVAIIAVVAASLSGGSESSNGSRIVAYTGGDVLGGKEIDFNGLLRRGQPVVLNFWAGLCPPCRREMPDFQTVYNEHEGEFILVGVDVGPFVRLGSNDDAQRLLEDLNITYPTAYAKSSDLVREYDVFAMPSTVFFTPDGEIFRKTTGFMTEDQTRSAVEDLLDESANAGE
jgi:thiol-disulfide isomerase/thioredoxin